MATHAESVSGGGAQQDALERLVSWAKANPRTATWPAVILVLGGLLFWWNLASSRTSERVASAALNAARVAFENSNYPLAASELSQITANYSGTSAAQEASLLLAHARILQGQPQQAVDLLSKFAPSAARPYQAQAYDLLGDALENMGRPGDAGVAFHNAADHAAYAFLQGQYLVDAGRAFTEAGDTAQAVAAFQQIVSGMDSTSYIVEAKVRLGELTRGAWKAQQ